MYQAIQSYLLKQKVNPSQQVKGFKNWDELSTICILLNGEEDLSTIHKIIQESYNGHMDTIVIFADKKSVHPHSTISLNQSDFSFFGIPKDHSLKLIQSKQYDLVINCDLKGNPNFKSLLKLINYQFSIGATCSNYSQLFDISLKDDFKFTIDYIRECIKYLKMINSTTTK